MKSLAIFLLSLFISLTVHTILKGQILTDFPCYAVSKNNGTVNNLFEYDPVTSEWGLIGNTGTNYVGAIAADSGNGILYTVESAAPTSNMAATLGTINLQTGAFTAIGAIGVGFGDIGNVQLNQIEGLTYDQVNQILYAVHRVDGTGPGTNDLLFQIDVATGALIPGIMEDNNGLPADYAVIEGIFDSTTGNGIYDVSDIAIVPDTDGYGYYYGLEPGALIAANAENGPGALSILDKTTGFLEGSLYDFADDDVESLGFAHLGELYATTGDDGYTQQSPNTFIFIDVISATTVTLDYIDNDSPIDVDFESFDCFHSALNVQPLCQAVLQLPEEIVTNTYTAETVTTDKDILNFTAIDADIKINASESVTLENVLISKNCDFFIDVDPNICN